MLRNNAARLVTIALIYIGIQAWYLYTEYNITDNNIAVPLDDTWIHFRFAENFAQGKFFEYNKGEPTPGTTSPLWVIILSVPFLISNNIFIPFSLILSSLFFLISLFLLYFLCIKL